MAPEVNTITPCEWGQFVILDNTIIRSHNYRNRLGYSYNPYLDAIDEDDSDGEKMNSYTDHKDYKYYEEDCFEKDGLVKSIIIRCIGVVVGTCITIVMIPILYFQS